jgi:hypothetical protein
VERLMEMPDAKGPIIVHDWNAEFNLVETPFGLIISQLKLLGGKATINTDPFSLDLEKAGNWEGLVEEPALQMFLERKAPQELKNLAVKLVPGQIRVTASVRILIELRVEAVCRLAIRDSRQILVELESVSVGGGAAKNLVQQQLDKINPVLDAKDLPLDLQFNSVDIETGKIVLRGTVQP